ncbi:hypothetical protein [Albidovulum sp.]|uniref:hypothetical protein n=1 Tax=Albidovulum sp. TaxID=1872424 RepID=UPI003D7DA7D4
MRVSKYLMAVALAGCLTAGPAVSGTIGFGSFTPKIFASQAPSNKPAPVYSVFLGNAVIQSFLAFIAGIDLKAFSTGSFQQVASNHVGGQAPGGSGSNVSAVPLPPAAVLLFGALFGLAAMGRRRSA